MKSSFSRNFSTAATILLLTLTILGASFQIQINNFLEDTTISRLTQDSQVVANLASAYGMDGKLDSRDLMLNLDVVSKITNADIVVCDHNGYIILCSGTMNNCDYDGWQLNPSSGWPSSSCPPPPPGQTKFSIRFPTFFSPSPFL